MRIVNPSSEFSQSRITRLRPAEPVRDLRNKFELWNVPGSTVIEFGCWRVSLHHLDLFPKFGRDYHWINEILRRNCARCVRSNSQSLDFLEIVDSGQLEVDGVEKRVSGFEELVCGDLTGSFCEAGMRIATFSPGERSWIVAPEGNCREWNQVLTSCVCFTKLRGSRHSMHFQSQGEVSFVEEIRLRRWARENYVSRDQRDSQWHEIILEEMQNRDCEEFVAPGTFQIPPGLCPTAVCQDGVQIDFGNVGDYQFAGRNPADGGDGSVCAVHPAEGMNVPKLLLRVPTLQVSNKVVRSE